MENIVAGLISLALIVVATLGVAGGAVSIADVQSQSWKDMEQRAREVSNTSISVADATTTSSRYYVEATVVNGGSTPLADFDDWDVILHYYDDGGSYHVVRAPYTSGSPLLQDQWTVLGIYITESGDPELNQPGILDPGEEMHMQIGPNPRLGSGTTNWLVVGTPNGVTASAIFSPG